jgi:hypothetical protein
MHVQPSIEARSDLYVMGSLSSIYTILTTVEGEGERAEGRAERVARFVVVQNCIQCYCYYSVLSYLLEVHIFLPHYGLGVDTVCNRNEYQGCL